MSTISQVLVELCRAANSGSADAVYEWAKEHLITFSETRRISAIEVLNGGDIVEKCHRSDMTANLWEAINREFPITRTVEDSGGIVLETRIVVLR